MKFGVHLPLIGFGSGGHSVPRLTDYARAAEQLGFSALAANDHLTFSRSWLDGPTALAAVLRDSGKLELFTTVALPILRGPVPLAKAAAALDLLSGGRLTLGVGAGSSAADYGAVGIPFDERWQRLDEAVSALRALLRKDQAPFVGQYYNTDGLILEPRPARSEGPPLWIGSWGSTAGLRRVARLADGWLASAYHATPERFAEATGRLADELRSAGRDPHLPNGLATMFLHLTDDHTAARRVVDDVLAPTLQRPSDELADRLLIGPAPACAELVHRYADAGVQRLFVWPVHGEIRQLETFADRVAAHIAS